MTDSLTDTQTDKTDSLSLLSPVTHTHTHARIHIHTQTDTDKQTQQITEETIETNFTISTKLLQLAWL